MNPKVSNLIKLYQATKEPEIMATLWECFQPLVGSLIKKYNITLCDRDDIGQEAFLKLVDCALHFDPSKGVPFESYYKIHLNYWFLNYFQKHRDLLVVDYDWENGLDMCDLMISQLGNAHEAAQRSEASDHLATALTLLTQKQHMAVTLFYLEGLSLTQVSKALGCSYKVAFKHKDAGLQKLRRHFRSLKWPGSYRD